MKQFLAGIVTASLIWGGLFWAQKAGHIDLLGVETPPEETVDTVPEATLESEAVKPPREGKRRRGKRRSRRAFDGNGPGNYYDTAEGVSGDVLDGPGGKELSMAGAGGEDQLSSQEIDQGIDRVFKGIERCLLTLPPDAPASGKVVFGMNIASSGKVTKVRLKGPRHMITGETGACFQRTVKSIRFRGFDGPDMVAHYPVTFD